MTLPRFKYRLMTEMIISLQSQETIIRFPMVFNQIPDYLELAMPLPSPPRTSRL